MNVFLRINGFEYDAFDSGRDGKIKPKVAVKKQSENRAVPILITIFGYFGLSKL